jgi:iron complex outermembrane receptor protein
MNRSAFLRQARCGALGLGLVVWPAFSLAQAQTLPTVTADVVVTATTTPVPADTVGRSVYRLTREDLFLAGTSSLVDGLRLLPGIDARARGGRDVQTDFSLRGATFGQTLVLLDGVRLNDSQSGHHNGEIPAPLVGLDRVEVLAGPASAVHGADALGGTIQFVTRTDRHLSAEASVGEHRTIAGQLSTSGQLLPANWTMTAWGARSDGFMFDRDYALGGAGLRGRLASGVIVDGRHQRRAFGANGFYGNSPSKEWTDGTMLSAAWNRAGDGWFTQARLAGRNHGDHFRWDIKRPGFAENRHRTNAADLDLLASRIPSHRVRLNVGAGGGGDRITSSNLGDHTFGRGYGFAELLWTPTARVSAQAGARYDHYSTFGGAWSPSVSLSVVASDRIRLRGSAARAFRIPTFTERFYNDPAHLASDQLDPERGWAVDAGVDADLAGWTLSATPFVRWDEGVIDWVRQTTADRWRTTNVRDVTTTGVEVSAMRRWSRAMLRVHYTALDVDAPALTLLSKYVLEYATHSAGVSLAAPIGWNVQASVNADHRSRYDGQRYTLLGARLTRPMGRVDLFVEGSNLLDRVYREIAGVPMPGRWVSAGIRVR